MHQGQAPTRFTMPAGLPELMHELEQTWPAMQAALRSSGVPLNDEETGEEREAREKREAEDAAAASAKKPWGDDKDFNPDKAWKLIENVRGDVDKLKKERDALAAKVKAAEDATKSEAQKLEERATNAETKAAAAERTLARLEVAFEKGLTPAQAKRLVGDTREELSADADELLDTFKVADDGGGKPAAGTRPKEDLRPGAAPGSDAEETDPEKLAASVPRMYR